MDLKNILSELRRIEALVDGWRASEQISAIERDLALDKLKGLYEAVRFAEVSSEGEEPTEASDSPFAPAPHPLTPAAEEPSNTLLKEPMEAPTEEPLPPSEEEAAVIDFDDLMPLDEPLEPIQEEPIQEEQIQEESIPEEPAAEPEEEPAKEEQKVEEEHAPAHEPEPLREEEPEAPVIQNSLFDMSELPVHRRSSRRVLLSLYGDRNEEHTSTTNPKATDTVEREAPRQAPSKREAHTDHPSTEPLSPLAEAIREEQSPATEPKKQPKKEPKKEPKVEPEKGLEPVVDRTDEPEPIFHETEVKTLPINRPTAESAPILGEVIHADQQTLADTFAPRPTVASSLTPAEGPLKEHIALNDRYLMRKELFGDSEVDFHAALEVLDRMPSLDDCMIYIAENYSWNANSEAARLLVELLERKFGE